VLNNSFVRGLGYVGYVIFSFWTFGMMLEVKGRDETLPLLCLSLFVVMFLMSFAISRILDKTEFFEWDYTERKKKNRFIGTYASLCGITCMLLSFDVVATALATVYYFESWIMFLISCLSVVFFVFAYLNIPSLFYPLLEKDLALSYKIQKKPEGWIDDGKEIPNEEPIEEIMRRDFGVNI
jgi:hypothetical protein